MTWGRWNGGLRDTSRGTRQGKQSQLQERHWEKWIPGYTKKPALASYTLPPSRRWRLAPHACWPYKRVPATQPTLIPLLLPMTQQRDNSPGLQQGRGYLLIPPSLKNRSAPYKQPRGQTLRSSEQHKMMAPQGWPSSLLPALPSKSYTGKLY